MRLIQLTLLTLFTSFALLADQRVQGFCEQGAQATVTAGISSTTKVQASYPSCTLTIYPTGSGVPVPGNQIYSTNTGTVLGNPFTADSNGHWFFYAANGRYDIVLSGGGLPAPWTIADVLLADPVVGPPGVTSFNARTGPVTSILGDYSFALISGTLATNQLTTVQGNGAKVQLATGNTTSGHCVQYDASGNVVDAGSPCATGSSSWVDAKQTCGAIGNGIADDSAALNSCLTTPNRTIFLPSGTYLLQANGLTFGADGIQFQCSNPDNTTIILGNASNIIDMVHVGSRAGITIRDCGFDQNFINQVFPDNISIYGISASGASDLRILGNRFHAFSNYTNILYQAFVSVISLTNTRNVTIQSNRMYSILCVPIQGGGNTSLWIMDNTFGSNNILDSRASTNYWDNYGGGIYSLNITTSTNVHINRNTWAGTNRTYTTSFVGGAIIGTALIQAEISDNVIDGMSNGYGTATVVQGSGTINFTVGFFATFDITPSRTFRLQGDGTAYVITGVANCVGASKCTTITVTPVVAHVSASGLLYQWILGADLIGCEGCQTTRIQNNILRNGGDQGLTITTQFPGDATVDVSATNNTISFIGGSGILVEGQQRILHISDNTIRNVAKAASLGNQACITMYPDGGLGPKFMYYLDIHGNSCIDDSASPTILYGIFVDVNNLLNFQNNSSVIGFNLLSPSIGTAGPAPSNLTATQWHSTFTSPLSYVSDPLSLNKGTHIETGIAGGDIAGTCTFALSTCTVTFDTAFTSAPSCTANDQTAAAPLRVAPSPGTVVIVGGAGSGANDVISYHCIGNPN